MRKVAISLLLSASALIVFATSVWADPWPPGV